MEKITHNFRVFGMGMSLILCLLCVQVNAQVTGPLHNVFPCGTDASYILRGAQPAGGGSSFAPVTPFDSSAIMSCGKFDLYFQDVNRHFHVGFDDTTVVSGTMLGAQRRAIFCDVVSYIQTVYDFSAIPNSNHIRILVDTSLDQLFHGNTSTSYYAKAAPGYDTTTNGIKKAG